MGAYLTAMGIERWRLRNKPAELADCSPTLRAYSISLLYEGRSVGLLLAEVASEEKAESDLVRAIAKATGFELSDEGASELPTVSELGDRGVLILLGARLAHYLLEKEGSVTDLRNRTDQLGNAAVVVTYSPRDLLGDSSLKADTWKDIKKSIKLIKQLNDI